MSSLPENAQCYKQTAIFTPENLPEKFRRNHHTKAGVWGEINMQHGCLLLNRYRIDDPDLVVERLELNAGEKAVFAPQEPHSVKFPEDDGAFFIRFYRLEC